MNTQQIYVTKNQEIQGPYTDEEIQTRLMSGLLLSNDLAWRQGVSEWKALSELFPDATKHKSRRKSMVHWKFSGFARASYFIGLFGIILWLAVFLPSTLLMTDDSLIQHFLRIFEYVCMAMNALGISLAVLAFLNKYSGKTKAIYGLIFNSTMVVIYWVFLIHKAEHLVTTSILSSINFAA